MERSGSKQETLTRLAVCVIAALILYSSAKPLCSLNLLRHSSEPVMPSLPVLPTMF